MRSLLLLLLLVPSATSLRTSAKCTTNLECSLNGLCTGGACVCDKPWTGDNCGSLKYKTTAASAKNIYNTSDPRNTWNGPIVTAPDGKYHIFDPIYRVGSLGGPTAILHGVADNITGPWDWRSQPTLDTHGGENPAFLQYKDGSGKTVNSLWIGGKVLTAGSLSGPWTVTSNYPGGNPAPIFHNNAFYLTNQKTTEIFTTTSLTANTKWTSFSSISHASTPQNLQYHTEDPFMWIDARKNWHIIGHSYANLQFEHCGSSIVSEHFFSVDGKDWHMLEPYVMPYHHTVHYTDGTSHTYTTLERPNAVIVNGQLTHLNLAADLVTGDEGCANRTAHSHNGHCPCDNCKWADHAGTTVIELDV